MEVPCAAAVTDHLRAVGLPRIGRSSRRRQRADRPPRVGGAAYRRAAAALMVSAPMSVLSMAGFTTIFAWALTRPVLQPVYQTVLIPGFSTFGLLFGGWYVGVV
jgi:hypothetical protein